MRTWTLAVVIGISLAAHAAESDPLQEKQRAFLQQCEQIEAERKEASVPWPEQYLRDLQAMKNKFQKEGDLDKLLSVDQELRRFQRVKRLPVELLVDAPGALRELQRNARQAPEQVELAFHKRIQASTVTYLAALTNLKQALTQQNRLEQALAVDREMDLLMLRPEVLNARLALQLADPSSAGLWKIDDVRDTPPAAARKAPVTSPAAEIPPAPRPPPDLAPRVLSYKYDDKTAKGLFSVDMKGKGMETRDWVVKNIGRIASSKELLLEAGNEPTAGGRYRVLNESLANEILTIEFEVLH
jgi:hypothetical protein